MLSLETEKKKKEKMSTTIPDVFFYSFFHECGWQVIKEKKKKVNEIFRYRKLQIVGY